MKKLDSVFGCEEISQGDMRSINGGESIGYWIGYAFGKTVKAVQEIISPCCSCTCKH